MKENSINKKEVDNGIKINIPIISNQEIENTINTENLYDKIAKQIYHDREMIILQEFIKKLQKENKELNEKILDNAGIYQLGFKDGKESFIKKIKDKIEELNREIGKSIDNSKGGLDEEFIEKAGELLAQKRILQELLEGRKI